MLNQLNVFHTKIVVELTETGLKILNEMDEKEKIIWHMVPDDSIVFFKNRIFNDNKLKTTIQELMYLFGNTSLYGDEFPIRGTIEICKN